MPLYEYSCIEKGHTEKRVAGIDDHVLICTTCQGLMVRIDLDIFGPYFEPATTAPSSGGVGEG